MWIILLFTLVSEALASQFPVFKNVVDAALGKHELHFDLAEARHAKLHLSGGTTRVTKFHLHCRIDELEARWNLTDASICFRSDQLTLCESVQKENKINFAQHYRALAHGSPTSGFDFTIEVIKPLSGIFFCSFRNPRTAVASGLLELSAPVEHAYIDRLCSAKKWTVAWPATAPSHFPCGPHGAWYTGLDIPSWRASLDDPIVEWVWCYMTCAVEEPVSLHYDHFVRKNGDLVILRSYASASLAAGRLVCRVRSSPSCILAEVMVNERAGPVPRPTPQKLEVVKLEDGPSHGFALVNPSPDDSRADDDAVWYYEDDKVVPHNFQEINRYFIKFPQTISRQSEGSYSLVGKRLERRFSVTVFAWPKLLKPLPPVHVFGWHETVRFELHATDFDGAYHLVDGLPVFASMLHLAGGRSTLNVNKDNQVIRYNAKKLESLAKEGLASVHHVTIVLNALQASRQLTVNTLVIVLPKPRKLKRSIPGDCNDECKEAKTKKMRCVDNLPDFKNLDFSIEWLWAASENETDYVYFTCSVTIRHRGHVIYYQDVPSPAGKSAGRRMWARSADSEEPTKMSILKEELIAIFTAGGVFIFLLLLVVAQKYFEVLLSGSQDARDPWDKDSSSLDIGRRRRPNTRLLTGEQTLDQIRDIEPRKYVAVFNT